MKNEPKVIILISSKISAVQSWSALNVSETSTRVNSFAKNLNSLNWEKMANLLYNSNKIVLLPYTLFFSKFVFFLKKNWRIQNSGEVVKFALKNKSFTFLIKKIFSKKLQGRKKSR